MVQTSASIASRDASLRRSWIEADPPGRNTRWISSRAASGSAKFLNAAWQITKSKDESGKGIRATSPCRKSTSTPAATAFSVAIRTKDLLMSRPVTL